MPRTHGAVHNLDRVEDLPEAVQSSTAHIIRIPESPWSCAAYFHQVSRPQYTIITFPGLGDLTSHPVQASQSDFGITEGVNVLRANPFEYDPRSSVRRRRHDKSPMMHEWTIDLLANVMDEMCRKVRQMQPELPIVLAGHSVSALAACALSSRYSEAGVKPPFDALTLVALTPGSMRGLVYRATGTHISKSVTPHPLYQNMYITYGLHVSEEFLDGDVRDTNADATRIRVPVLGIVGTDDPIRTSMQPFFDNVQDPGSRLKVLKGDHNFADSEAPVPYVIADWCKEIFADWTRQADPVHRVNGGQYAETFKLRPACHPAFESSHNFGL